MHPLEIKYSSPLEREFEAWIIQGIEDYFKSLGQNIAIWAVSPANEVNWPADEHLVVEKKLIGLQLKKVEFNDNGKRPKSFGRLKWTFHNPKNQYDLVVKFPEIFYCLPTFVNRDYKVQALQHCIFWRPKKGVIRNLNAWYDNREAKTPHYSIGNSLRWGRFIENVMECQIGKKVETLKDAKNYINSITGYMKERSPDNDIKNNSDESVYIIALPYKS